MNGFGRLLVVSAALALAACSHGNADSTPAASAPAQAYLAIARGQVDIEGGLIRITGETLALTPCHTPRPTTQPRCRLRPR